MTGQHTVSEIMAMPESRRVELLSGMLYDRMPPDREHQRLQASLSRRIGNEIERRHLPWECYNAPFGVFLDEHNYVEPDLSIVCDLQKLSDRGCEGAPDWVIEIVSPSSQKTDEDGKASLYMQHGAKEYWMIDPDRREVRVMDVCKECTETCYRFEDDIPVSICSGFSIRIAEIT